MTGRPAIRTPREVARWNTAVHEVGHLVAAQTFGARGVAATVRTDWQGRSRGLTTLRVWRGSDLDHAVYTLAGAAAGLLITGDEALSGSDDIPNARQILAEINHPYRNAQKRAAALVRRHRAAIERAAERLYQHGRI